MINEYVQRLVAAQRAVQDVRAVMAGDDERRRAAGEPAAEDERFNELTERAEQAEQQRRAAWLGRDAAAAATDKAVADALDAMRNATTRDSGEPTLGEEARRAELAGFHEQHRAAQGQAERDNGSDDDACRYG